MDTPHHRRQYKPESPLPLFLGSAECREQPVPPFSMDELNAESTHSDPSKEMDLKELFLMAKEGRTWALPRPVLAVVSPYGMQILREACRLAEWDPNSIAQAMSKFLGSLDLCGGVMIWTCNHLQRDEVRTYCTWEKAHDDLKDLVSPKDIEYLKSMASSERENKQHGQVHPE